MKTHNTPVTQDVSLMSIVILVIGLILFKLAGFINISWWVIVGILLFGRILIILLGLLLIVTAFTVFLLLQTGFEKVKAFFKENFRALKR